MRNANRWKYLSSTAALALLVGVATTGSALADVTINATFFKNKDTNITETIYREKAVFLQVQVMPDVTKFSEALSLVNQATSSNSMVEQTTHRVDEIVNSVNNNVGLTILNQSSGDLNQQGSSASGTTNAGNTGVVFSEAQAGAEQRSNNNSLVQSDLRYDANVPLDGKPDTLPAVAGKTARIENAIKANTGVVHVNQAVGNMNNQANTLALATSFGQGGIVLADAVLGQKQTGNSVAETGVLRTAIFTNTVIGNTGIVSVNQAAGNLANQANVVAIGIASVQAGGAVGN